MQWLVGLFASRLFSPALSTLWSLTLAEPQDSSTKCGGSDAHHYKVEDFSDSALFCFLPRPEAIPSPWIPQGGQ